MASALQAPVVSLLQRPGRQQWCAFPRRRSCWQPLRAAKRSDSSPPRSTDSKDPIRDLKSAVLAASMLAAPAILDVNVALAKDGEFGLLEGRSVSLVHPAMMFLLFGSTCYAGWLGWQWRRTREIGNEIKKLKKELPPVGEDGTRPASPLTAEIAELDNIRKDLVAGGYRDRHFNQGSLLLAGGVGIAFFGGLNTYLRAGKLFPGPHLYAGAIIVVLWAFAASLVPAMQKGNEAARIGHILLNVSSTLMFVSQIPTGLEICFKVLEQTNWP